MDEYMDAVIKSILDVAAAVTTDDTINVSSPLGPQDWCMAKMNAVQGFSTNKTGWYPSHRPNKWWGDKCVRPKRDSRHKESRMEKLEAKPDKNCWETDTRPVGVRVRKSRGPDKDAECRKALRGVESVTVSSAVNGDSDLTVVQVVHESNQKCFVTNEYSAL